MARRGARGVAMIMQERGTHIERVAWTKGRPRAGNKRGGPGRRQGRASGKKGKASVFAESGQKTTKQRRRWSEGRTPAALSRGGRAREGRAREESPVTPPPSPATHRSHSGRRRSHRDRSHCSRQTTAAQHELQCTKMSRLHGTPIFAGRRGSPASTSGATRINKQEPGL